MSEADKQQGQVATPEEAATAPAVAKAPAKGAARKVPPKKAPAKRVRRTKAQIESDEIAELRRKLELAEARANVAQIETQEARAALPQPAAGKKKLTYHFVEDGFTAFGKTWYRGEEITLVEGSEDWGAAFDRFGVFIFEKGDYEQMEAYNGTVFYRQGPWPGLPFDPKNIYEPGQIDEHGNPVTVSADEIAAIEKVNTQRSNR